MADQGYDAENQRLRGKEIDPRQLGQWVRWLE